MSIFHLNDSGLPDDRLSPEPVTTAPCVQCGVSVSKASKFCPECGAATSTACSHCGVAIPTTAKFCLECGASQSPQQDAPVTSDSSKPFAQPNGTEAEPNGGRLQAPADAEIEDMPLFGWASSSVSENSEPKELSGPLKLVLICGALVLAIACVWGFTQYQQENAVAHYKRGEELKSNNDLIGAQRELKACLVECPDGWQKNTAREELERIEPLIAAQGKPQPDASTTHASVSNGIQFRGLRAGMPKAEVSSLLTHPGDKLECEPEKNGEQSCHCTVGDAIGNMSFSPSEKLFHFELTLYHAKDESIYEEMTSQMGEGENVEHGELAGTILAGMRQVKWKTATTVPWLLDRAKQYPSVELTLTFGSAWPQTELTDWGYYADREGLTASDPNEPHPTVEGRFSMYGVRGGEQVSEALVALRHYDGTGCQIKQEDSSTECRLSDGALEWNLSFYAYELSSFTLRFPASDWSEQVAYLKKTFGNEPTDTDRRNSSDTLSWKSASSVPCLLAPEKKCTVETFILSRTKGESEAQANYLYAPVLNEQIRAKAARYPQR